MGTFGKCSVCGEEKNLFSGTMCAACAQKKGAEKRIQNKIKKLQAGQNPPATPPVIITPDPNANSSTNVNTKSFFESGTAVESPAEETPVENNEPSEGSEIPQWIYVLIAVPAVFLALIFVLRYWIKNKMGDMKYVGE
jgi:hypothetical protein